MAQPVPVFKSSVASTTNSSPYTLSPTWQPVPNSLLLVFVVNSATTPQTPTGVTGHGLTYTNIPLSASALSTTHHVSLWAANSGSSPSTTAVSVATTGSPTGCAAIEYEVTGIDPTELASLATQAANSPIFAAINVNNGTGTSGSVMIPLAALTVNEVAYVSFFAHLANEATTARSSPAWTEGGDGNYNTPATGAEAQFYTAGLDTTASATWTSNVAWRGAVVALKGNTAQRPSEQVEIFEGPVSGIAAPADESVCISESLTAGLQLPDRTLGPESIVVSDSLTVRMVLNASISESIKIDDIGEGITQLIGTLRITDTVQASLFVPAEDLSRNVAGEALVVADALTAEPLPLWAQVSEALKLDDIGEGITQLIGTVRISDVVSAEMQASMISASVSEAVSVVDTVTTTEDPLLASQSEALRISDAVEAAIFITASLSEALRVSDSPTLLLNPEQANPSEALVVQDSVAAALVAGLSANVSESLKVVDAGHGLTQLIGVIRINDTVTAQITTFLSASVSESVKIADDYTTGSEAELSTDETIKISDTVTASLGNFIAAELTETAKISDTVTASRGLTAELMEAVSVVDTVTAARGLTASLTEEARIADTLTSALQLAAALADESLIVQDSLSATEDPLQASVSESLSVVDLLGTGSSTSASETETVRVTDTVTATLNPLQTAAAEAFIVQDTAAPTLNPLRVSVTENVSVVDTATVGLGELVVSIAESIECRDSGFIPALQLAASVAELVAIADTAVTDRSSSLTDGVSVVDTVTATMDLLVTLTEGLGVADSVESQAGTLLASASESARIADTLTPNLVDMSNMDVVRVTATYAPSAEITGTSVTSKEIIGTVRG